jgi:hypothetical protein
VAVSASTVEFIGGPADGDVVQVPGQVRMLSTFLVSHSPNRVKPFVEMDPEIEPRPQPYRAALYVVRRVAEGKGEAVYEGVRWS